MKNAVKSFSFAVQAVNKIKNFQCEPSERNERSNCAGHTHQRTVTEITGNVFILYMFAIRMKYSESWDGAPDAKMHIILL